MNPQIRELLEQSTEVHDHWHSGKSVTTVDYQVFAELIISKCIQLIDDSTPVYSSEDLGEDYCKGTLNGYESAILELKKHFGVHQ